MAKQKSKCLVKPKLICKLFSNPDRRNKCGILAFIANFERFVQTTELIFKSSERRVDLEKWYLILVTAMVTAIARWVILEFGTFVTFYCDLTL